MTVDPSVDFSHDDDVCNNICRDVSATPSSNPDRFSLEVGDVHYIAGVSANPKQSELAIKVFEKENKTGNTAYIVFQFTPEEVHKNPRVVDHSDGSRTAYLFYPPSMKPTIEALLNNRNDISVSVYVQYFDQGHIWASVEATNPSG